NGHTQKSHTQHDPGAARSSADRQRDLADRDPRGGDCRLLRDRADLRRDRAGVLRRAHRRRLEPDTALHRLPGRAGVMMVGVVEILFGVNAEGKSLEEVTKPLSATDEPPATGAIASPA